MADHSIPEVFSDHERLSVGLCFSRGLELVKKSLGPLVVWSLFLAGLSWLIGVLSAGIALAAAVLVTIPASLGLYAAVYATARGEEVTAAVLFSGFKRPAAYILGLLVFVSVLLGTVAFVVPGIYLLLALVWTECFVQGRDKDALTAYRSSIALFNRNLGFCLILAVVSYVLYAIGTMTFALAAITLPIRVAMEVVGFELLLSQDRNRDLG